MNMDIIIIMPCARVANKLLITTTLIVKQIYERKNMDYWQYGATTLVLLFSWLYTYAILHSSYNLASFLSFSCMSCAYDMIL